MEEKNVFDELLTLLEGKEYAKLREIVSEHNDADIAAWIEELDEEHMPKLFRIQTKDQAADVFSYLDVDLQQKIIGAMSDKEAAGIIDNLMADDAADLMDEMPANIVTRILAKANPDTRREINQLLRYPDDSAGSIMTVEYVDLKENLTVQECIDRIRRVGVDKETIDTCYVLDLGRHLIGTVSLRDLLHS